MITYKITSVKGISYVKWETAPQIGELVESSCTIPTFNILSPLFDLLDDVIVEDVTIYTK